MLNFARNVSCEVFLLTTEGKSVLSTIFKQHRLSVITYEEITSGFSMTQKYLLTTHEKQYILKIYPLATFERIQQQRSFLSQHQKNHCLSFMTQLNSGVTLFLTI